MTCPAPRRPPRRPPPEHGHTNAGPTARQLEVLAFVHLHLESHGRAPSTHELCTRFGWRSTNAPTDYLQRLEAHGLLVLLERASGISRTVRLTSAGVSAAKEYLRAHVVELLRAAGADVEVARG